MWGGPRYSEVRKLCMNLFLFIENVFIKFVYGFFSQCGASYILEQSF